MILASVALLICFNCSNFCSLPIEVLLLIACNCGISAFKIGAICCFCCGVSCSACEICSLFAATSCSLGPAPGAAWATANCAASVAARRSEEHTSELQSRRDLVCRLLLEKKKKNGIRHVLYKKKKRKQII